MSTNKRSTKQHLSFGMLNARSVKNKTTPLCEYIGDNRIDVVAITETWLSGNDQMVIGNLCPPGYSIYSEPRCFGKGGGVALIYNCFES